MSFLYRRGDALFQQNFYNLGNSVARLFLQHQLLLFACVPIRVSLEESQTSLP
jgi:hypothetical protein